METIKEQKNNVYLVVIRGPLGVGKSTISKEIAERLNASYISIDQVLEDNGLDNVSKKEGCIPAMNFIEANEIALPTITESLRRGQKVIVDGNFYHMEALTQLLEKANNYDTYIFTLKCLLEVCIQRDSQRTNPHGSGAAAAVHKLVSRFDSGICIQTEDQDLETTVNEVMSHLPS